MEKFIMRLRDLIESSGEKQVDICRDMKISKQKLSAWKSGYSLPNYGDLMRLADYFEVSADYLLGRSDDFGTVVVLLLARQKLFSFFCINFSRADTLLKDTKPHARGF